MLSITRFVALSLICGLVLCLVHSLVCADDNSLKGTFKGNGKEGTLKFVSARKKKEEGKDYTVLVFSEKDHSKEKQPDTRALFGHLGDALIITLNKEGKVVGCFVFHSAHKMPGFNSLGEINVSDFKSKDGKVSGKLSTGGEVKAFGETWQVDLTFNSAVADK